MIIKTEDLWRVNMDDDKTSYPIETSEYKELRESIAIPMGWDKAYFAFITNSKYLKTIGVLDFEELVSKVQDDYSRGKSKYEAIDEDKNHPVEYLLEQALIHRPDLVQCLGSHFDKYVSRVQQDFDSKRLEENRLNENLVDILMEDLYTQ